MKTTKLFEIKLLDALGREIAPEPQGRFSSAGLLSEGQRFSVLLCNNSNYPALVKLMHSKLYRSDMRSCSRKLGRFYVEPNQQVRVDQASIPEFDHLLNFRSDVIGEGEKRREMLQEIEADFRFITRLANPKLKANINRRRSLHKAIRRLLDDELDNLEVHVSGKQAEERAKKVEYKFQGPADTVYERRRLYSAALWRPSEHGRKVALAEFELPE